MPKKSVEDDLASLRTIVETGSLVLVDTLERTSLAKPLPKQILDALDALMVLVIEDKLSDLQELKDFYLLFTRSQSTPSSDPPF